ncbi:MAG: tetratricopeptide repeat protein [Bacteroidales bacterium]|nr:tetratricopeptide repeat protein [Bacteroidales bacterium]
MMKRGKFVVLQLGLLICNLSFLWATPADLTPSRKAEYYFLEGIRLKNVGKFDSAFEMFQHALKADSANSAALYELSNFYTQLNRIDVAQDFLQKAIALDSTNFNYRLLYANISKLKGDLSEAVHSYEILASKFPDKPELNYYLAELYAEKGEYLKAIKAFDDLEQDFGVSEAISLRKYQLYNSAEKEEEAFAEIEKLMQKYPADIHYIILMGNLYMDKDKYQTAYEYYEKASKLDPDSPDLLVALVRYYEVTDNKEHAIQLIEKALTNPEVDVDVKLNILSRYISMLQRNKKDTAEANSLFELLLEQHPQVAELHQIYGAFLLSQGKTEEARFQFQVVTEMEPSLLSAWQQLMGIYMKENDTANLIRICKNALEYHPEASELYYFLGIAYYQEKQMEDALDAFDKGLTTIKNNPGLSSDFYGQMGDIYYQSGKREKAFKAYDEALTYNPDNVPVLNNYAYFLTLEKRDLSKAERMSGRCVKLEPSNFTYLDTYAWVFFVQGNYSLAKIYIESAINNGGGETPEIVEHYGDILYKLNDLDGAMREWAKAKDLNSESKTLDTKLKKKKYIEETFKK